MTAVAIQFPKNKKRGAKVRRGPMAAILSFPAPLSGKELRRHWAWLEFNRKDWRNEDADGVYEDDRDTEFSVDIAMRMAEAAGCVFSEARMRADIAKWRAEITKRTQVKDWLEALGVDWNQVRTPEQALVFAFEQIRQAAPRSA